ncbi:hypothetical protein M422DRAFT_155599 [Sphaerobolus stellatus SS14]|nr:hypothetical protein M422DRAFT_155599 [Sphaerobolus stellatus SS14]
MGHSPNRYKWRQKKKKKSYEMDHNLVYYPPYDKFYPKKQVMLLQLWDEIGLPHSIKKEEFGASLGIIGFHVDPACMTLSIPHAARTKLVTSKSCRRPLKQWQQLLGWCNWALNVFPLLRPALQSSYLKISGKAWPNVGITLNRAVIVHLR